jgi:hypothetical protein
MKVRELIRIMQVLDPDQDILAVWYDRQDAEERHDTTFSDDDWTYICEFVEGSSYMSYDRGADLDMIIDQACNNILQSNEGEN